MTQSNTSSSQGSEVSFESQEGDGSWKSPRMERFLEEGRVERKGVGSAICWGGANRGGVHIKK